MTTANSYQYTLTATTSNTLPNCTILTTEISYSTFTGNTTYFDLTPNQTMIIVLTRQSFKNSVITINRNGNYSLWSANKLVDPNATVADSSNSSSYTKSVLADGVEWWFVITNPTPNVLRNQSLGVDTMTTTSINTGSQTNIQVVPGIKQSFKMILNTKQVIYTISYSGNAKLDLISDVKSFGTVVSNTWLFIDSGNYLFGQFTANTTTTNVSLLITYTGIYCLYINTYM